MPSLPALSIDIVKTEEIEQNVQEFALGVAQAANDFVRVSTIRGDDTNAIKWGALLESQ
jgi:hypothetical protein